MATLSRVRFVMTEEGPTPMFQGFHRGEHGMSGGAIVYVTAHTLRQMVEWHDGQSSDFDRIHNRMENEEAMLAFGGSTENGTISLAPDGYTPLYMVTTYEPLVIQRYNPKAGLWGLWENVEPHDGDITPVGFTFDAEGFAAGRSDTPNVERAAK